MFELFLSFAKIGIMTFGGGLAMLPMLERELVDNKKWIDKETLLDFYAIGQCTPGIIAVNVATMVGKRQKGFWGSVVATLGIVFPSVVIISILAAFFNHFAEIEFVQHAFAGARIGVCVVVLNSLIGLLRKQYVDHNNLVTHLIYVVTIVASLYFNISPVIIAVLAVITGIIFLTKKDGKGGSK